MRAQAGPGRPPPDARSISAAVIALRSAASASVKRRSSVHVMATRRRCSAVDRGCVRRQRMRPFELLRGASALRPRSDRSQPSCSAHRDASRSSPRTSSTRTARRNSRSAAACRPRAARRRARVVGGAARIAPRRTVDVPLRAWRAETVYAAAVSCTQRDRLAGDRARRRTAAASGTAPGHPSRRARPPHALPPLRGPSSDPHRSSSSLPSLRADPGRSRRGPPAIARRNARPHDAVRLRVQARKPAAPAAVVRAVRGSSRTRRRAGRRRCGQASAERSTAPSDRDVTREPRRPRDLRRAACAARRRRRQLHRDRRDAPGGPADSISATASSAARGCSDDTERPAGHRRPPDSSRERRVTRASALSQMPCARGNV